MDSLPIYQVDAFTDRVFGGNYAAVCPLKEWLAEDLMQAIAAENNLPETAFFVPEAEGFAIRWFTPVKEVPLAGHPTLAAAHVLFEHLGFKDPVIRFRSAGGPLSVSRNATGLTLDFPTDVPVAVTITDDLKACFSATPREVLRGAIDFLFVFQNETELSTLQPNLKAIGQLPSRGAIATAPGDRSDFVSRYFAPQFGIDEDPVTGSAHVVLTPYWAARLGKQELSAIQISRRRGHLQCALRGPRVHISGQAVTYMIGEIVLPQPRDPHVPSFVGARP
jgi:PhzF family phenazine biosynthesis protein